MLRRDETARTVLFGAVLLLHAAIWFTALSLRPGLAGSRQLAAEMFSTLALVSISLNLILSTRARFIERNLYGLDKLFVTHRTIGLTIAFIIVTHFLLVPKSPGLVPSKPFGYTNITLILGAIFLASAPRFPWRRLVPLKYETWKSTHRANGFFVVIAVFHSLYAHTYTKQVPLLYGYVYGIAALGFSAWVYREFFFGSFGPITAHTIEAYRPLKDAIAEVTLSPPDELGRRAGQFGLLRLAAGPSLEDHPYTISSPPQNPLRFSIHASGDYTNALQRGLPVGSDAWVEGPYGAFLYRRGRPYQLWLAGGIGITPFLSMAADLDDSTEVLLVWSVRTRAEAAYEDELSRAAEAHPKLTFVLHPTAELGHLDPAALSLAAPAAEYSAFLCGPFPMRVTFQRQLRAMGVPRSEVYFEEFRLR